MVDRIFRGIAGSFILISLILAYFVSRYWLLFTAFIGIGFLQSAFTNFCFSTWVLKKLGVK